MGSKTGNASSSSLRTSSSNSSSSDSLDEQNDTGSLQQRKPQQQQSACQPEVEQPSWLKRKMARALSAAPPHRQMTRAQEAANALTMLLPVFVCWAYVLRPVATSTPVADALYGFALSDPLALLLAVGTTAHFPASFSYHASCVFRRGGFETLKKMDFTMLHAASVLYSFATSASLAYALLNVAWNLYALRVVWRASGWRKGERARGVLISVALYTLPIAVRGDLANYAGAVGSFLFAGGLYWFNALFQGWDHAVFHLVLPAFQYFMLLAASNCYGDNKALVDGLAARWLGVA